jgi:GH15 family glucan-1,4-alpha-glucosidase
VTELRIAGQTEVNFLAAGMGVRPVTEKPTGSPRSGHPTLGGSPFPPIAEYGFLSDCEVTALVAASGNVEWMCLPRMDSPSLFAPILDRGAGWFRLGPADVNVHAPRARALCEKLLSHASPLFRYAEEIDPHTGRHLGNFPQAFSHLALINTVMHLINTDEQRSASSPGGPMAGSVVVGA